MLKKLNSLKKHNGFMKYFKNTSWLLGEKILRMIIGLFIGIWIARYLGPEQFGIFSYAQSFVGLFIAISTLGLNGIIVRELVKDEEKRDILLGTAFILKIIGAIAVLFILLVAINFTSNDSYINILIFIIASSTIFQSFNVIDFYFQSKVLSRYIVYANTISLLISSIVKITLLLNEAPLINFAWIILFDSFVLALGFIYFYFKNNLLIRKWKFSKKMAYILLKDSWPLILSGLVISLYMKIDQVMIKEMLSSEAVGQYAVAVELSQAWYFLPMIISSSLFPAILNAKEQSKELYYDRLQKLYTLMAWVAISIALPTVFISDWLIHLLYGEAYNQSGKVLIINIWAGVFVFLGVASSKWFIAENLQKYSFYRTLAGAVINITLNYILIPIYSIYGAAFATLISQAVASYLFNATNKKLRITFLLQTKAIFMPWKAFKRISNE